MIKLTNGPYDGRSLPDEGQAGVIKMGLARKEGNAVLIGHAIYEIEEPERKRAFWLMNDWPGTLEGEVQA